MFKDSPEGTTHFNPEWEATARAKLRVAKCLRCGRTLKNPYAIKIGYGSHCQKLYNIKSVKLKPLFRISEAGNEPAIQAPKNNERKNNKAKIGLRDHNKSKRKKGNKRSILPVRKMRKLFRDNNRSNNFSINENVKKGYKC